MGISLSQLVGNVTEWALMVTAWILRLLGCATLLVYVYTAIRWGAVITQIVYIPCRYNHL